ncbi:unnamed protein product [Brachionus calyciflorus]|uniref:Uncharacterized protein n=1 Tax=Brachionus calyciflorus TaxID=104777 RepID=A0A813SKQ2_9BILA|nr:unnamed protein product [Brachionus calyciflorus]
MSKKRVKSQLNEEDIDENSEIGKDTNREYTKYYYAYKKHLYFETIKTEFSKTTSNLYRSIFMLKLAGTEQIFEVFVAKAKNVKESREKVIQEFFKQTVLIHPDKLPQNKKERTKLIKDFISSEKENSANFNCLNEIEWSFFSAKSRCKKQKTDNTLNSIISSCGRLQAKIDYSHRLF